MNSAKQFESEVLRRMQAALEAGRVTVSHLPADPEQVRYKSAHDPVTQADRVLDEVLRRHLLQEGECWFSEESRGGTKQPAQGRVWIVDPLDGTREYLAGVPEWCLSVALMEDGRGVAGGICNPVTGEMFLGSRTTGVTYNGRKAAVTSRRELTGGLVLASRSEFARGEWERFRDAGFAVKPVGSVAYKLALVAAGLADATWTLVPKHLWDVAAGAFLVEAAGGFASTLEGASLSFDRPDALIPGIVAGARGLKRELLAVLAAAKRHTEKVFPA
jgi:myo-inositol-1(or 4)-monophosphatase